MSHYLLVGDKSPFSFGLKGVLNMPLSSARELLSQDQNFEVSPIAHEPGREFLAAMSTSLPQVEITLDHYHADISAIIGYSLSKPTLIESCERVARILDFSPDKRISPEFKETLCAEHLFQQIAANTAVEASSIYQIDSSKFFEYAGYMNFLTQYCNQSQKQAAQKASLKFGIQIPY